MAFVIHKATNLCIRDRRVKQTSTIGMDNVAGLPLHLMNTLAWAWTGLG